MLQKVPCSKTHRLSLSLLQLYLAFLSTLHGHILLIRSSHRFSPSDKKYHTVDFVFANYFAVSALR